MSFLYFFFCFSSIYWIYGTQKYNLDKKELLNGSSSQKTSQPKSKGPKIKEKKEGKERAITNPNAPIGLQDIQPLMPRTQAKTMPPPQRLLDPPTVMDDATYTVEQDNEKAKAQNPGSPPDLPRVTQARKQQQSTVQPTNLTATASRKRIIKHKEQFFPNDK